MSGTWQRDEGLMTRLDNGAMHLLIPYASAHSADGIAALQSLQTPNLDALLQALEPEPQRFGSDEYDPLMPHERLQASLRGLDAQAAALPTACWQHDWPAALPRGQAWALLTPLHFSVGSDQVTALAPSALQLDEAEARAFLDALGELFPEAEGWRRELLTPERWLLGHEQLDGLASASIDRVLNRAVDAWMPEARPLRRWQNEVQMLLHGHPLNQARAARGLLPLNSVWISGCGRDASPAPADLTIDARLCEPWLQGDWAAWAEAWAQLDAGPLAALRAALPSASDGGLRLSLAGERLAASWVSQRRGLWQSLQQRLRPTRGLAALTLETL